MKKVKKLHQQTDLVLYAIAVIAESTDGKVDVLQKQQSTAITRNIFTPTH
ncbi:hypothetical protein [Fischerella sp. JS2]|nr:hypothetical protein [Fischerella sp. JS2]